MTSARITFIFIIDIHTHSHSLTLTLSNRDKEMLRWCTVMNNEVCDSYTKAHIIYSIVILSFYFLFLSLSLYNRQRIVKMMHCNDWWGKGIWFFYKGKYYLVFSGIMSFNFLSLSFSLSFFFSLKIHQFFSTDASDDFCWIWFIHYIAHMRSCKQIMSLRLLKAIPQARKKY